MQELLYYFLGTQNAFGQFWKENEEYFKTHCFLLCSNDQIFPATSITRALFLCQFQTMDKIYISSPCHETNITYRNVIMSRKGRWRRNQQRQNEEFAPRGFNQSHRPRNGNESPKSPELDSYHVTHAHKPTPSPPVDKILPPQRQPHRHDHPYERPHITSLTSLDFRLRSQQLKQRLVDYLEKSLGELEEWYPEAETQEGQMDWKPEVEVVVPQVDGGMQWAWGHERPDGCEIEDCTTDVPASPSSSEGSAG